VTFVLTTPPYDERNTRQYIQLVLMHDCYIDLDQQFTLCVEVRLLLYSLLIA
jgi:hypothetical protein